MSGEEAAVVIYGAGGHGKVVLDALERSGRQVVGFADDDATRVGTQFCGYPVALLGSNAFGGAVEIVVAIGDGELRAVSTAKVMESGFGLAIAIQATSESATGHSWAWGPPSSPVSKSVPARPWVQDPSW
jgi:hypothetical protein